MSAEHLERLRLSSSRAATAADFLEACGDTMLAWAAQDEANEERQWGRRMDAASAFREAAQWAMFLDVPRATQLLARSGAIFLNHGFGYGTFLMAATGERQDTVLQGRIRPMIRSLELATAQQSGATETAAQDLPAPLRHPQQQVYLLLACAAPPLLAPDDRERLLQLARNSPNRLGVLPVGALGTPLRRFWDVALHLLASNPETGPAVVVEHLQSMSLRYGESMELAMTNDYLWDHGAAPVDVIDFDLAVITALGIRAFGRPVMGRAMETFQERVPPVARTPVELGAELVAE